MKKLIALLLFSGWLQQLVRQIRLTLTPSKAQAKKRPGQTALTALGKRSKKIEEETKKLEQLRKDFNMPLTNENAVFPQLSTDVAEDEAEVKITTTEGDITVKPTLNISHLRLKTSLPMQREATTMKHFSTVLLTTLWSNWGS